MNGCVSVIVPAFNCAAFIGQAIDSVLSQTYTDTEIIVVDDGSTDDTGKVLSRYGDRIQVLPQENRGVAAARNTGLDAASGDFVAFLDADDVWRPEKTETQLATLERFPASGGVFSDFYIMDEASEVLCASGVRSEYALFRDEKYGTWGSIFAERAKIAVEARAGAAEGRPGELSVWSGNVATTLFQGNFINTCSVLLRTPAARACGYFDASLRTQEDYDYWLRLATVQSLAFVDYPLVGRRKRRGQLTGAGQIEEIMRSTLRVLERSAVLMEGRLADENISRRLARKKCELGLVCMRQGNTKEARTLLCDGYKTAGPSVLILAALAICYLPSGVARMLDKGMRRLARFRQGFI